MLPIKSAARDRDRDAAQLDSVGCLEEKKVVSLAPGLVQTRGRKVSDAAVKRVEPIVQAYLEAIKSTPSHSEVELEVRFGNIYDGRFVAGVTRENIDGAVALLSTNPTLLASSDWHEFHDFYFDVGGRGSVRQRSLFDSNALCIEKAIVTKERLVDVVVPHSQGAFRVSLSREVPVDVAKLPSAVGTTHMRIQRRRRFTYVPRGGTALCHYDASVVFSGANKTAAEQAQLRCEPSFEFEIEFVDASYFVRHDAAYGARSILMKACDMYGVDVVVE